MGSGCGTVGRGVAFNTEDPQFESHYWQKFIGPLSNIEKMKHKEKETGIGLFKNMFNFIHQGVHRLEWAQLT